MMVVGDVDGYQPRASWLLKTMQLCPAIGNHMCMKPHAMAMDVADAYRLARG